MLPTMVPGTSRQGVLLGLGEEISQLSLRGETFPFKKVFLELSEGTRLLRESPIVSSHI